MKYLPLCLALLAGSPALAQTITIQDDTGRTVEIPSNPERIVVLHEPLIGVPLMDLGLPILASYGRDDQGAFLTGVDFVETVLDEDAPAQRPVGIGPFGNLDLERIRALQPDLILGTEFDLANAERLAGLAPVYLQNAGEAETYGYETQADLARLLGLEEEFATREAAYHAERDALLARMPSDPEGQSYLAALVTDRILIFGQMSGLVQALEDLGYQRLTVDETAPQTGPGSRIAIPISPEVFLQLDPDLLILMASFNALDRSPDAIGERLDRIAPGWRNFMAPLREDRVVYLDSARVSTPSISSAENTLEGLAAWLDER